MKNFSLLCFLTISTLSYSQDLTQKLKSDVAKIQNGKFIIDDFTLVKANGSNLQLKFHSEAVNTGFISRDNFIYISSEIISEILGQITATDQKAETEDLDEITGTADIIVNCYMTKTGVQVETTSPAGTEKNLEKWSDLL